MSSKAGARYAKSLLDLSKEQNAVEEVKNDMVFFEKIVDDNSELEAILKNPIVPLDKKKGRSSILFDTAKQFVQQYNAIKGIVTAEVTSASALTDANRAEVITLVKKELGANEVLVKEKVNPELIGGFILKVGDRQFDASIASGLNKLKKEFAH